MNSRFPSPSRIINMLLGLQLVMQTHKSETLNTIPKVRLSRVLLWHLSDVLCLKAARLSLGRDDASSCQQTRRCYCMVKQAGSSLLACEDLGRAFDHSLPACAFLFKEEISSRTLIPLFRSGSVHGGSVLDPLQHTAEVLPKGSISDHKLRQSIFLLANPQGLTSSARSTRPR